MNRGDFLKALGALPFLSAVIPREGKAEAPGEIVEPSGGDLSGGEWKEIPPPVRERVNGDVLRVESLGDFPLLKTGTLRREQAYVTRWDVEKGRLFAFPSREITYLTVTVEATHSLWDWWSNGFSRKVELVLMEEERMLYLFEQARLSACSLSIAPEGPKMELTIMSTGLVYRVM